MYCNTSGSGQSEPPGWVGDTSRPQVSPSDTACSTLVALATVWSWGLGASDGADPDGSLSITDALVVDDDGRHHSNLPRCAHSCRQLLGAAINVAASAATAAGRGDDAMVLAAAISTAKAQVEPPTSSSLPILLRPGVGVRMAPTLQQVPQMRRSDAQHGRWRLASALSCFAIVASCATIEFSNLRHLADSPPACPMPDAAPVLTGSLAPCLWRRHGACARTVRLAVHRGARARHGRASSGIAHAFACLRASNAHVCM